MGGGVPGKERVSCTTFGDGGGDPHRISSVQLGSAQRSQGWGKLTLAGPPKATTSPCCRRQGPFGMRFPFKYVPLRVFLSVTK
jgi:hypothetical protein